MRSRVTSSTSPAVSLIASCGQTSTGSRTGTIQTTGSPIGTCSAIPRPIRAMRAAFRKPGGMIATRPRNSNGRGSGNTNLILRSIAKRCISKDTISETARRALRNPMTAYIARRILFMIPTLFGIMLVAFAVVQFAPGGPVERVIAQLSGADTGATSRISGSAGGDFGARGQMQGASQLDAANSKYRGAQGLDPEFIKRLEKQFGFDKPAYERFFIILGNYATFDFGKSYFRDTSVLQLIKEKLPVSISLGLWMTLATYLISIPLGIKKAVSDGSHFDVWTSGVVIIGNAIPGFLFAVLLIVLFAGGSFFDWFPLRGLTSDNWAMLPWWQKI